MIRPISISLSPNVEKDDVLLCFKSKLRFWKWKEGEYIEKLEKAFKDYLMVPGAVSFNSGRSAFLAILESLGLSRGDEVLLQAFTCNAASNPIIWAGLRPVYVDVLGDTFNIDPSDLRKKISERSKAVVVQHTFGLPANIDEIAGICKEKGLFLIEDCAHSLGACYKGGKIGTFGEAAFFSFSRDKIISSVYGGIAVAKKGDLCNKIREFQKKISYPSRFWIIQQLNHPILLNYLILPTYSVIGKYILIVFQWLKILSKAVDWKEKRGRKPGCFPKKLPNALAVLAFNQFNKLEKFNRHRKKVAEAYAREFGVSSSPESVFLRFSLRNKMAHKIIRDAWKNNLLIGDWYTTPIAPHDTKPDKVGYEKGSCPVAEKLAEETFNLPTHINIKDREIKKIVEFIKSYEGQGNTR